MTPSVNKLTRKSIAIHTWLSLLVVGEVLLVVNAEGTIARLREEEERMRVKDASLKEL